MPIPGLRSSLLTASLVASLCVRQEPVPLANGDGAAFFESRIRPLLAEHCYECHSDRKTHPKGGLRLDTRAGLLAGGENGPVIVPGDPEASRLVRAVRRSDPELEMPPDEELSDAEIADLIEWVRRGAPDPRTGEAEPASEWDARGLERAREHWAFRALADPAPPAVADGGAVRNEIDRFVLAELEEQGLASAPEADRRTLLRRASYDLLGLPPTSAELEDFANDPSSAAWERVIERLLSSPHYGERWGRRWLDLARYSDSNGLDENLAMANAWRYRDWVVQAFNEDLAYDRFLTLQLAGDLLPEPEDGAALRDQLTATGFLVLGPKMLAEQDKEKLALDVVDEQLDVTSQAFLGLTMGCARCHDHKFDPIPTEDYYALAGIFRSTKTLANLDFVSRWNQRELAPRAAVEARALQERSATEARQAVDGLFAQGEGELRPRWHADLARYLLAGTEAARRALLVQAEEFSRGNLKVDREQYGSPAEPVVHSKEGGTQFAAYDLTFPDAGRLLLEIRYAAEESRPVRVILDGKVVAESALGEVTGSWKLEGQRWAAVGPLEVRAGRNVLRIEREGDFPHLDQLLLVPADVDWLASEWSAGLAPDLVRGWALYLEHSQRAREPIFATWHRFAGLSAQRFQTDAAQMHAALRAERDRGEFLVHPLVATLLDGLPPASLRELAARYQALFAVADQAWRTLKQAGPEKTRLGDEAQEQLRLVLYSDKGPFALEPERVETHFAQATRDALSAARARLLELEKALPPAFDRSLGAAHAAEIVDLPVHIRGSHLNLAAEKTPRGFPHVLDHLAPQVPIPPGSSGRLELARWMLQPGHPLTARVMVNRIWQGHFGQGLVRTPSNFGLRGEPPSHPELLDWLAREFVRRGWSVKAMHRLILASATYRRSSTPSAEALERDPENRWLAHQNRRRLEAEELRDSLLALSGALDRTLGGTLLETKDGEYVTNDQSSDRARYDTPRRSLYLPIVRNAMYHLFATFDYGDPGVPLERRSSTTAPDQALWMMNSPLVLESARRIATEVAVTDADEGRRIAEVWRRVLGRAPSARELELGLAFLVREGASAIPAASSASANTAADPLKPLAGLCQTLLLANEFLYLD